MAVTFKQLVHAITSGQDVPLALDPRLLSPPHLQAFVEFGTKLGQFAVPRLNTNEVENQFRELKAWVDRSVDPKRPVSAFLDTTTIGSAEGLLRANESGRIALTPSTLLDLSTFVNAVILNDTVFHLESPNIDTFTLNEALGNEPVFVGLPVKSFDGLVPARDNVHSVGAALRSLWLETNQHLENLLVAQNAWSRDGEEAAALVSSWSTLLGSEINLEGIRKTHQRYVPENWASDGPQLIAHLLAFDEFAVFRPTLGAADEEDADQLLKTVVECNCRCFFNICVSSLLRLPYWPNAYRLPLRGFLQRRAIEFDRHLLALKAIEAAYRASAMAKFGPQPLSLTLPVFLAAIVSKVDTVDGFYVELAELRRKAAAFRQTRRKLEDALSGAVPSYELDRLKAALTHESEKLTALIGIGAVAAATASVLSEGSSALAPAALGILAMIAFANHFPPEVLERLTSRVLTPRYWFLTDSQSAALTLVNAYPRIRMLWGEPFGGQSSFTTRYSRLAELT